MRRLPIVLLVLVFAACGGSPEQTSTQTFEPVGRPATQQPPSAAEAKELIATSSTLGEFEFTNAAVTIPMQKSAMNEPQLANAKQLVEAGWIAFDGSGTVVLTKAQGDKRFVIRPNGFLDVVPIAKKEMGEVTSVRATTPGEAEAEFIFTWVPTEVGTTFTSGPVHEMFGKPIPAKATLLWEGTAWGVLRVVRQPPA